MPRKRLDDIKDKNNDTHKSVNILKLSRKSKNASEKRNLVAKSDRLFSYYIPKCIC